MHLGANLEVMDLGGLVALTHVVMCGEIRLVHRLQMDDPTPNTCDGAIVSRWARTLLMRCIQRWVRAVSIKNQFQALESIA